MGILNVTPDSFADAPRAVDPARAIEAALRMEAEGADLIDLGGESTRPGAAPVSAEVELARVLPVATGLAGRLRIPLSIDTSKASVARAALDAGAAIVNDVSGLGRDPELAHVVAERSAALVLMHGRGTPKTMDAEAVYLDVVEAVIAELGDSLRRA
ncbi:MAG: dihydropteroate synthase, partial [Solirubrobacteraceae bacterium]